MKLDQLLFESSLNFGEPPKRPKDAPPYYDALSIPDQRLWIKLNSIMEQGNRKPGTKFKIKTYHSPGSYGSSFYGKGRVSKDDFVQDSYEIESLVTDFMLQFVQRSVTGRNDRFIWSKDKGIEPIKDFEPDSYLNRIGPKPTKKVNIDGFNVNSIKGIPDNLDYCNISRNPIKSIDDFPSHCKELTAIDCEITTLKDIHKKIKYCEKLYLTGNPIKSNILGLLKIEGLKVVSLGGYVDDINSNLKKVERIIEKYLHSRGNIFDCQEELIEAGFAEYASL